MELNKEIFKEGLDIPLMLESARIIVKHEGYCDYVKEKIQCSYCPLNYQKLSNYCLAARNTGSHRPNSDVFKAEALDLSRQFIALFDAPKTHHINFMEE